MTFIKPQRQAAPWSDHNWWGQYDDAANLPNTATSDIQVSTAELQEGDVAWAAAPGAGSLYVCTDPTAGFAIWQPISFGGGATIQTRQDYYVDGDNGSDDNPGTSAAPFATIARAVSELPEVVTADHYIHLVEAPIAGSYDSTGLEKIHACLSGSVIITGENVNVIASGTLDGATSNRLTFTDSTQAFTPDDLIGKTVRFTSGSGDLHYRTILENDGTTFTIGNFIPIDPSIGDTYEIVEPTVAIDCTSRRIGGSVTESDGPFLPFNTIPGYFPSPRFTKVYANLIFENANAFQGNNQSFLGCELQGSFMRVEGVAQCGQRSYSGILNLPSDADDPGAFYTVGWGMYVTGSPMSVSDRARLQGFVSEGVSAFGAARDAVGTRIHLMSGRLTGGDTAPALSIPPGVTITTGNVASARFTTVIIKPKAGSSPTYTTGLINCFGGSFELTQHTIIDSTAAASASALRILGGMASFLRATAGPQIAAAAGQAAIRSLANGAFVCDNDQMDNVTSGGANAGAVVTGATGATTPGTTGAGGDFTTNGSFVQGGDGSIVSREAVL